MFRSPSSHKTNLTSNQNLLCNSTNINVFLAIMSLQNTLASLLLSEAHRPAQDTALFNTASFETNSEHFPVSDAWWNTGSICVAMLQHEPGVVTAMMIVGVEGDKRYAITLESTPKLVEFTTDDLMQIPMKLAKVSTQKDTKLFVPTSCANGLRRGLRIAPLRTEYLHFAFNEDATPRHPHEFYHALKDIKDGNVRMIQAWAKAACLKTSSLTIRSAIELSPTILPQFADPIAYQKYRDISDAFVDEDDAHDVFVAALLKEFNPIIRMEPDNAAVTEDRPQAQTERPPQPADDDSDIEDVTPAYASRNNQDRQHTRRPSTTSPYNEQRSQGRYPNRCVQWNTSDNLECPPLASEHFTARTNYAAMDSNSYNNNSGTHPWTQTPRNSWGAHSGPPSINRHSTGTSTFRSREPNIFTTSTRASSSLSPFGSSPSSSAADKLKELSELCTQRPPTTSEMNQWNILNAMIGSPTTSATDETKKNFLGMQQFSVLAWANVHPNDVDYLNNHNNYFWPKLNACKNKPDARHVVRTEMFQHLIHKHPKLITCLHDDLIETIINFRFKPVNLESDKPTLGLGPMAFVPRDRREIEMMSHQISINEQSDSPTTSDIDKTRLGRPKIPDGASGTTSTIESCALVNDFLWAPRCPYVNLAQGSLLALYEGNQHYEHQTSFGTTVGAECLFQLTRGAEQFFGQATSERQLLQGQLPTLNFNFLIEGIRNNNLNTSQTRPSLFVPAQTKARPAPGTPRGPKTPKVKGQGKGAPPATQPTKSSTVTRQMGNGMTTLINDWKKAHNKARMPNILDFRKASDIADDAALQTLLNLNTATCIRWALLGSCRSNCKRDHPQTITGFAETAAEDILRKGLPE